MSDAGSPPPDDRSSHFPPPPALPERPPTFRGSGAGPAGGYIKPVRSFATAIMAVASVSIAITIGGTILQLRVAGDAEDFLAGVISEAEFENRIGPFAAVGATGAVVLVTMLALLAVWSHRMANNLVVSGRFGVVWKGVLAVIAWILSGCTFYILSLLALREHWKASDPGVAAGDDRWRRSPIDPVIVSWFVVSAAGAVLTAYVSGVRAFQQGIGQSTEDLAEQFADDAFVLLSAAFSVASGVLLILTVLRLTTRHIRLVGDA